MVAFAGAVRPSYSKWVRMVSAPASRPWVVTLTASEQSEYATAIPATLESSRQ